MTQLTSPLSVNYTQTSKKTLLLPTTHNPTRKAAAAMTSDEGGGRFPSKDPSEEFHSLDEAQKNA